MMISGSAPISFPTSFTASSAFPDTPPANTPGTVARSNAAPFEGGSDQSGRAAQERSDSRAPAPDAPEPEPPTRKPVSNVELDEAQALELSELKARDREVRAHEMAHQAVGGQYAGSASYTYRRGPDGVQYAVGGEVPISVSPLAGDPQGTIEKMRVVRAAALAPAEPSSQDRAVAAEATQVMLKAQIELNEEAPAPGGKAEGQSESWNRAGSRSEASLAYQSVFMLGSSQVSERRGADTSSFQARA
ncbi:putative metalloprotease CJM1_0395 family protein [Marinobacter salicampi]|uniref:putative metalloprotease CJM1_0395 family protein n=1 Tax=Marinobacter salicampi TaxID=435907 RepID=UPI001F5F8883|nr:putative metalloprotease CJM1_0395 family protein [Marinobacter salicampi]